MKPKDNHSKGPRLTRRALMRGFVYSSIAATGSVAYASSDNLEILKADVPIKGLSASLDGLSIGVMADFHAGALGTGGVIEKSISSMKKLKPDVITLLGDFVDGANSHGVQAVDKGLFLFKELESLSAPLGVYAVLGNHDHWADSNRVTKLLKQVNIVVLHNENILLPNGLILAGVDDYWARSDPDKALAGVGDGKKVILLSHNPDINHDLRASHPIDLVLSGHTHGGQIRVPFTGWAPWVSCSPRYKNKLGLFRDAGRRWTFISKGIGCFFLPVRLSCPPDIALLRLRAV